MRKGRREWIGRGGDSREERARRKGRRERKRRERESEEEGEEREGSREWGGESRLEAAEKAWRRRRIQLGGSLEKRERTRRRGR